MEGIEGKQESMKILFEVQLVYLKILHIEMLKEIEKQENSTDLMTMHGY